jgi:hypothetical protein
MWGCHTEWWKPCGRSFKFKRCSSEMPKPLFLPPLSLTTIASLMMMIDPREDSFYVSALNINDWWRDSRTNLTDGLVIIPNRDCKTMVFRQC